jgi:hypothetical protein
MTSGSPAQERRNRSTAAIEDSRLIWSIIEGLNRLTASGIGADLKVLLSGAS